MDDNIWEYPFGELDEDDDDTFYRRPETAFNKKHQPLEKIRTVFSPF
jgi:hypothetical protein